MHLQARNHRLLAMMKLMTVFEVFEDEAMALSSFAPPHLGRAAGHRAQSCVDSPRADGVSSPLARLATAAMLIAAIALHAQNPRDQHNPGPEAFASRVLASDLENPWTVLWGPDGYLWVTERTAFRVKRVNPADGSAQVALALTDGYQAVVQDGLMGMALHPDLLQGRGRDYVFVVYTYDADAGPGLTRRLRVRRYTYDRSSAALASPTDVISNLPAHDDHGGGALVVGPDDKLYLSRGDLGANWLANYCMPVGAQDLPRARDVEARDWSTYQGKVLRMNLDRIDSRRQPGHRRRAEPHLYLRAPQHPGTGLRARAAGCTPRSTARAPTTRINLLAAGKNYGWPTRRGLQRRPRLRRIPTGRGPRRSRASR